MKEILQTAACFKTGNPDQFSEFIQTALPTDISVSSYYRKNFHVETTAMRMMHTGLFKIHATNLQGKDSGQRNFVSVTIPLEGIFSMLDYNCYQPYTQGSACISWENQALDFHTRDSINLVINFDLRELGLCWYKIFSTRDFDELKKIYCFSLQPPQGADFWNLLYKLWCKCCATPALFHDEKAIEESEANLMTLFLLAVDAQANQDNAEKPCQQRISRSISNAENYINANLSESVSIADIAQVAKLHPRTLYRRFKQQYGLGPHEFLKQRRLEAAQRSLFAADRNETTVTQQALRYNFCSMGQFAVDYRKAFGESPSETLRR